MIKNVYLNIRIVILIFLSLVHSNLIERIPRLVSEDFVYVCVRVCVRVCVCVCVCVMP